MAAPRERERERGVVMVGSIVVAVVVGYGGVVLLGMGVMLWW